MITNILCFFNSCMFGMVGSAWLWDAVLHHYFDADAAAGKKLLIFMSVCTLATIWTSFRILKRMRNSLQ